MQHIGYTFIGLVPGQTDILIALLADIGFTGFEEENDVLKAFIPRADFDQVAFEHISLMPELKFTAETIEERNWNAKWEADFEPVAVMDPSTGLPFAYIRAGFHEADASFEYDLIVTPKMSFGTGHHDTTHLVVQQMSQLDFSAKTVIDYGTGTGVLAILAAKLGAAQVTGIDCDDWSIENAIENVAVNGCTAISIIKGTELPEAPAVDIILANINLNIILANLPGIVTGLRLGGQALFSGIMTKDEAQITAGLTKAGLVVKEVFTKGDWLAILCTK